MDVPGVGPGPTGSEFSGAELSRVEFSNAVRALAGPQGPGLDALLGAMQSGDTTTSLLRGLSELEVTRLLQIIDRPIPPEMAARLDGLLRASVSAAAEGNVAQALSKLAELAPLDPQRAETLDTEPGLVSIHPDVVRLLSQLMTGAQLEAEARLEQATVMSQTAGSNELAGQLTGRLAGQELRPEIAILIASRFLEAGGYVNCMHSTELSQLLINQYVWAPTPVSTLPDDTSRRTPVPSARLSPHLLKRWTSSIKRHSLRAPLLVLLLAWFAAGLLAGSISALVRKFWPQMYPAFFVALGFEIWGVGFLGLVAFAFYASVRNRRK